MGNALAQIGILAAGIAAGHALIMVGSSAARKMKSSIHRHRSPPSDHYQPTEKPNTYRQHQYPTNYYR